MKAKSVGAAASTAAWIFGIATSVLFVSLWGRAVVVDTNELGDSLRPLSQSGEVANAFSEWMTAELVESGVPNDDAENATDAVLLTDEVSSALEVIVVETVDAATRGGSGGSSVDVAAALHPAVPAITSSLVSSGVPIAEPQVREVVLGLDPIVIRDPGQEALIGSKSPLASHLGTAALIAVITQIVFGSMYVMAGPDRLTRLRTLLTRFAVTGISFAVLLKLGSWVLDPNGGRAPISTTLSLLADSKWVIPALLGAAGAVAALFVWVVRGSVRQAAEFQPQRGVSTPRTG